LKRILYICTAFYPENAIGSIRNTKIVKYLAKQGYDVTVISPDLDKNVKLDKTLYFEELEKITHVGIPYSNIFIKLFLSKKNEIQNTKKAHLDDKISIYNKRITEYVYLFAQEVYTLIRNIDWKSQVIKYLKSNPNVKGFDYVISGYPSLSSHLLGEFVMKKKISQKWVCDFRDPIAYESLNSKLYCFINKKLQKKFCIRADIITHVTKSMNITLSNGIKDKSKFYYLPNGYDNDDINVINESKINIKDEFKGHLRIAYVGSLYDGKRDLSVIFEKIKYLNDHDIIEKDKIKFIYAGKDFDVLYSQARKFYMENILVDMGFVSREDSLAIQKQSSVVIVNTWNTEQDKGILTGKVYECFLLKKPTLAIINGTVPNSELGAMITKAGIGLVYDTMVTNSKADIKLLEFFEKLYKSELKGSDYQLDYNVTFIENFNYMKITKNLINILDNIDKNSMNY
jgi:hypothetical protein